ncbi:fimbrial protein [Pseudomonas paralactis]|uniref:Fimbrial protein n=2 Tax=Pseudomonas paralactis TaxID=1615673 RepID=A0ABS0V6I1_9PSED|nr:fimbrial protein [Pseudomonas paralactis]
MFDMVIIMRWSFCFVVAFFMCSIMQAQAFGVFTPGNATVQLPVSISTPGSLAIGSVIWSSPIVVTQLSNVDERYFQVLSSASQVSGFEDVFFTGVAGIGVRYKVLATTRDYPGGVNAKIGVRYPIKQWAAGDSYQQEFSIELVKVGSISTTSVTVPSLTMYLCPDYGQPCWSRFTLQVSGTSSVKVGPSCKVSTPVIPVRLGKVSLSSFANIGDASSPSYFSISLSCTGGDVGVSTYPYVTLTDVVSPGNISDVLSLSTGSTASGIGIQVFHGDDLLKFGPDSSAPDNVNQWKAGEIKRGEALFQIPLRARYVRTGKSMQPGTANGQATFTFSWR